MNTHNMLLTRDLLSIFMSMIENDVSIDMHLIKREIDNENIFNYLSDNYPEYFNESLLLKDNKDIKVFNKTYKNILNDNYRYLAFDILPAYSINDWFIEKNGINLLICYIYDIYTFRLLKC